MTDINQSVRFTDRADDNNPLGLYDFIKPTRLILSPFPPQLSFGENFWWYIDTSANSLYVKENGIWVFKYVFGGGSTPGGINGATNVGGGSEVFKQVLGTDLIFRTLIAGDNVNIVQGMDTLTITATLPNVDGFITALGDTGTGVSLIAIPPKVGTVARVRKLICNDGSLSIIEAPAQIIMSVPLHDLFITNALNVGTGVNVYRDHTARDLNFRRFNSPSGKITFTQNTSDISVGVNLNKSDVGLNWVQNIANAQGDITFPPASIDDITQGYLVGSLYVQSGANPTLWVCTSNSINSATWVILADANIPVVPTYPADLFYITGGQGQGQLMNSPNVQTLNILAWTQRVVRGSWSIVNLGFGLVVAARNTATDGQTNNVFQITYNLLLNTLDPRPGPGSSIIVGLYRDNLGTLIPGSESIISFGKFGTTGYSVYTPCSHTVMYQATTATNNYFQLGVRYPNQPVEGNFTINITTADLNIVQIK